MSILDEKISHKRRRLDDLRKDMKGINPKLSLWQKMKDECAQIENELAMLGNERTAV